MEIEFYKTIVKMNKPKYNIEKGCFGVVDETKCYYILCEKNSSQYKGHTRSRHKYAKKGFDDKFTKIDSWHCYNCGNDSHTWRCMTC